MPDLDSADISDTDLLSAIRALTLIVDREAKLVRPIDYRNLGPDELGGVYEGLLELHPSIDLDASSFALETVAGSERKSTGSYYTPETLIANLLDSALEPLLNVAAKAPTPEASILALRVLDPAVGSGHFLTAAGRRIARRLASVRTGDPEPAPEAIRHALRDVVGRCLYGIDSNPMALELAKINLWLEAIEPGRALTFLDHHLACGDALLGTTPDMLARPIPDEAYKALTDDDKATAATWRKINAGEAKMMEAGHGQLALGLPIEQLVSTLAEGARGVDGMPDDTAEQLDHKAAAHGALMLSAEMIQARLAADAWCAAFFAPKRPGVPPVTTSTVSALTVGVVDPDVLAVVGEVRARHGLLHWHLAFPDVFAGGGFSLVVGNPPWEKVKLSEKEFFAARDPEISKLAGAKRKARIARLEVEDAALWADFRAALRSAEAESAFLRTSGRYPLCGRGDVNTYSVFAEAMRDALSSEGRLGVIVPSSIATDDTTKAFFADCVSQRRLVSLLSFENEAFVFPGVHHAFKFCLLTIAGAAGGVEAATFLFYARRTSELNDSERLFSLTPDDLELLNPNTRTAAVFRTGADAELTKKIYRRVPVLLRDGDPEFSPWRIEYQRMFDMSNDSELFRSASELAAVGAELEGNIWRKGSDVWLPLYEAKMAHHFTHRWGDYAMKRAGNADTQLPDVPDSVLADPTYLVQPRYWVAEPEVRARQQLSTKWLMGFRRISNTTNERTFLAFSLPAVAAGDSIFLIHSVEPPAIRALLPAVLSSLAFDYVTRNKLGGTNLSFFVANQLPVLTPSDLGQSAPWSPVQTVAQWMSPRVLELTYTADDMAGFASDPRLRRAALSLGFRTASQIANSSSTRPVSSSMASTEKRQPTSWIRSPSCARRIRSFTASTLRSVSCSSSTTPTRFPSLPRIARCHPLSAGGLQSTAQPSFDPSCGSRRSTRCSNR